VSRPEDEIACEGILLRGLLRRHVAEPLPGGLVCHFEAFLLRPATPDRPRETQLSVNREALIESPEELFRKLRMSAALASLHCGRVRDVGLSVSAQPTADDASHAAIGGLPHRDDGPDAAEAAERYAVLLARMARIRHRRG